MDITENTLEEKKVCATMFLDVKQAFDKVWHKGLMTKLHKLLPKQCCKILESYISGRLFRVKQGSEYSNFKEIKAGTTCYDRSCTCTYGVPQTANTKIATFADNTAIMAVGDNTEEATDKLQQTINVVN
jgi:hypothetical protein